MTKLTKDQEAAYHNYVHTPTESNTAFIELGKQISGTKGISLGSSNLDFVIIPTRPGWYRYHLARPGEGKTTMLNAIALNEANRLENEGLTDRYYVARITWEEAADSQELHFQRNRTYTNAEFWRGEVPVDKMIASSMDRPNLQVYTLGDSMLKTTMDSMRMTVKVVIDGLMAIWYIENKKPSLITLDYAQEIEVEGSHNKRTEDVIQAIQDVMYLGIKFKCPLEIGVQAAQRSLDNKPWPIPSQRDIEWAFYIHQKATTGIAYWRPWVTHKDDQKIKNKGNMIGIGDKEYRFSPNLMVASTTKHRPGLIPKAIPFLLYPDTLTIEDFDDVFD